MLTTGQYKARGVEAALGFAGTGKEQIAVLLEVSDGEKKGETITWYGYFTEQTVDRTIESLETLGWTGDDISKLDGVNRNEVQIVVEEEEGRAHPRVKWINRLGGLAMKVAMSTNQATSFAQRMKATITSHRAAKSGGTKVPPRAAMPGSIAVVDSDDIPF
jgi:hypothetical protein